MITQRARPLRLLTAAAVAALALAACGLASSPSHPAGSGSGSTGSLTGTSSTSASQGTDSGFRVLSMSFVSDTQGFALGTVACGARRCLALLATSDGGARWTTLTPPPARPGSVYDTCKGGGACVQQIRFATSRVGYAFGPALFVTTDRGAHWRRLDGANVSSLEIAGGTTARVVSGGTGCAGQPYRLQSAPAATATWQALPAPRIEMICPPVLYRQGTRLVLVGYGNPAGGVRATARIDRSSDGGQTWAAGPDSCGGKDGYASGVALAPPDVLVLLCQHQMPQPNGTFAPAWVRISTNGGATFGPDRVVPTALTAPKGVITRYQLAAGTSRRIVVSETGTHGTALLTTQDGGGGWRTSVRGDQTAPFILVGFEDPLTARAAAGNLVWTTTNGGQTWHANRFTR